MENKSFHIMTMSCSSPSTSSPHDNGIEGEIVGLQPLGE